MVNPSLSNTVIFSAPSAWGKTHYARALQLKLGCCGVVEEWNVDQEVHQGHLHLTNAPIDSLDQVKAPFTLVLVRVPSNVKAEQYLLGMA